MDIESDRGIMIGNNIKRIRMARGIRQSDMAERLNVSAKTISSWEVNRTEPNFGMLEQIAEVLNCSKSDLISDDNPASRLRELISYLKLTPSEFAEANNIPKSSISMYINGKRLMKADRVSELAIKYDINATWLMGMTVPMKGQSYRTDSETATISQEVFHTPAMRILFDTAREATPEDLYKAAEYLKFLKWKREKES